MPGSNRGSQFPCMARCGISRSMPGLRVRLASRRFLLRSMAKWSSWRRDLRRLSTRRRWGGCSGMDGSSCRQTKGRSVSAENCRSWVSSSYRLFCRAAAMFWSEPEVVLDGIPSETADGKAMADVVLDAVDGTIESIPASATARCRNGARCHPAGSARRYQRAMGQEAHCQGHGVGDGCEAIALHWTLTPRSFGSRSRRRRKAALTGRRCT